MPNRKREPASAVTARSRKFRARKKLRKIVESPDGFLALDLTAHYAAQKLPKTCFILAEEFGSAYLTEDLRKLVTGQEDFSGIESALARVNGSLVKLIRPS